LAFLGCARLQLAVQGVRYMANLNHARHVHNITACAAHVKMSGGNGTRDTGHGTRDKGQGVRSQESGVSHLLTAYGLPPSTDS
jgi:hypothetical protein